MYYARINMYDNFLAFFFFLLLCVQKTPAVRRGIVYEDVYSGGDIRMYVYIIDYNKTILVTFRMQKSTTQSRVDDCNFKREIFQKYTDPIRGRRAQT